MYIGRIYTKSSKVETLDYVNVTSDVSTFDTITPTLIIGKKNAEELYGKDKIHVLDKHITTNVSWTYAKNERRNEYEKDLSRFNDNLIKNMRKNVKYIFFNIFIEPLRRIKNLIKFIDSSKLKTVYITDSHIYIYYNNIVYGISLDDIEYAGIGKEKVINRIKSNKYNIIVENSTFLSSRMKNYIKDDKILVPYLHFLTK